GQRAVLTRGELPGRQVHDAEQCELEPVLHSRLLEEPGKVDLYRAFRNHQLRGDLFVLETLREKADELRFTPRQSHTARGKEVVRERFFEPQLALLDAHQTFHLQIRGQ